jgi:hypothetical protein
MVNARQLAKQLLKAYTAVFAVEQDHDKKKLMALLNTRPKYALLELEHPYYDMAKQTTRARKEVVAMAQLLIDCRIGQWTVREVLEDMRAKAEAKGERDHYIEHLLEL